MRSHLTRNASISASRPGLGLARQPCRDICKSTGTATRPSCCFCPFHAWDHVRPPSRARAITTAPATPRPTLPPRPLPAPPSLSLASFSSCRLANIASRRRPRSSLPAATRTFFSLFEKQPRTPRQAFAEPGWPSIYTFAVFLSKDLRMPRRGDLVRAFRALFIYKKEHEVPVTHVQAELVGVLLRYLRRTTPSQNDERLKTADEAELGLEDFRLALDVVSMQRAAKTGDLEPLLRLIKELYRDIASFTGGVPSDDDEAYDDFVGMIRGLAKYGGALEAVEALHTERQRREAGGQEKLPIYVWAMAMGGLALERRQDVLVEQVRKLEDHGYSYSPVVQSIMVSYFAQRNRPAEVRKWLERPVQGDLNTATLLELARLASRNSDTIAWAEPVFQKLTDGRMKNNAKCRQMDAVLVWSVLVKDAGVDQIRLMIKSLTTKGCFASAGTIEFLIMAAVEKSNPLLAERFSRLGDTLGILPNISTRTRQLSYRTDTGDLQGARESFRSLLDRPCWGREEVLAAVNKYARRLCEGNPPDLEALLETLGELERMHAALEAETVVALCLTFLNSDKQFDVMDTLALHTVSKGPEERAIVRNAFVEYCCNTLVSTARVWDAYQLLRQFFPDTALPDRMRVMRAFFMRKRPDMGCLVFGQIEEHIRKGQGMSKDSTLSGDNSNGGIDGNGNNRGDQISDSAVATNDRGPDGSSDDDPDPEKTLTEAYVQVLEWLGRFPDLMGLRSVYNRLKLETGLQVDTRLYNALMLAYTACDLAYTAIEFWHHAATSAEGPSQESLAIVFWTCEKMPLHGAQVARPIWQKMMRLDLEVPKNVAWSYAGALAAGGHLQEVMRLVAGMDASLGYPPSSMTLGVIYNALRRKQQKRDFEAWAKTEYPEAWTNLEHKGRFIPLMGHEEFKIQRIMKA